MAVISRGKTIQSIVKTKSVIRSDFEKDIVLNPGEGFSPKIDDLVALRTADSKHYVYDTAGEGYEIEGVITNYDSTTKTARICVRGRIQKRDLNLTIYAGTDREAEREMRKLGLDLV